MSKNVYLIFPIFFFNSKPEPSFNQSLYTVTFRNNMNLLVLSQKDCEEWQLYARNVCLTSNIPLSLISESKQRSFIYLTVVGSPSKTCYMRYQELHRHIPRFPLFSLGAHIAYSVPKSIDL